MGKLYIVPTPIGNLEDMTFRAIRILKEVDLILAEDTRTSGKLLKHFEIGTHMHSHHMHNEHKTVENLISRLKAGETIALISDAGTPAISDPGFLLTRACVENKIDVECLLWSIAVCQTTDSFSKVFCLKKKDDKPAIWHSPKKLAQ
jgi:16S rRNA (cytidine1402-2'-O)-methyltransferase